MKSTVYPNKIRQLLIQGALSYSKSEFWNKPITVRTRRGISAFSKLQIIKPYQSRLECNGIRFYGSVRIAE